MGGNPTSGNFELLGVKEFSKEASSGVMLLGAARQDSTPRAPAGTHRHTAPSTMALKKLKYYHQSRRKQELKVLEMAN